MSHQFFMCGSTIDNAPVIPVTKLYNWMLHKVMYQGLNSDQTHSYKKAIKTYVNKQ